MPTYNFGPYSNFQINVMKYLGAGEPVVNFLNVDKGITTLAIKINLNSSIKDIKNRTI